jgi:hypothetical protein
VPPITRRATSHRTGDYTRERKRKTNGPGVPQ